MKIRKFSKKPLDISERIGAKPVVCYPNNNIEEKNLNILHLARKNLNKKNEIIIPPRDAKTFQVKGGEFFRIESVEGPQVGDLNLFNFNKNNCVYGDQYSKVFLENQNLREGIKVFSDWPTIPQLYVKNEFVGGCDIVKEMFETGELAKLFESKGVNFKSKT